MHWNGVRNIGPVGSDDDGTSRDTQQRGEHCYPRKSRRGDACEFGCAIGGGGNTSSDGGFDLVEPIAGLFRRDDAAALRDVGPQAAERYQEGRYGGEEWQLPGKEGQNCCRDAAAPSTYLVSSKRRGNCTIGKVVLWHAHTERCAGRGKGRGFGHNPSNCESCGGH